MNYEIIENITSADIAVRVKARSLELLFQFGAEALMSEMVENINTITPSASVSGFLDGEDIALVYFDFLNEFLFYKDAENLLLLPFDIRIINENGLYSCSYILKGEKINTDVHNFRTDIKAVTLHNLNIYRDDEFFVAETVFDV